MKDTGISSIYTPDVLARAQKNAGISSKRGAYLRRYRKDLIEELAAEPSIQVEPQDGVCPMCLWADRVTQQQAIPITREQAVAVIQFTLGQLRNLIVGQGNWLRDNHLPGDPYDVIKPYLAAHSPLERNEKIA